MAWYIELHCDVYAKWPDDSNACYSGNGDSPSILVADNASPKGLTNLRARCKANGWVRLKGEDRKWFWACPACATTHPRNARCID